MVLLPSLNKNWVCQTAKFVACPLSDVLLSHKVVILRHKQYVKGFQVSTGYDLKVQCGTLCLLLLVSHAPQGTSQITGWLKHCC